MSITVKNYYDAFPSSSSIWFVNSLYDNTSAYHQTATSSADKPEKHEGTDMWKSEAGGEFQVFPLLSALWWDKIYLRHSAYFHLTCSSNLQKRCSSTSA